MAKAIESSDRAADKVGKLLPSEVTGLYLSVRALFTSSDPKDQTSGNILLLLAALCLLASIVYIRSVRNVTNRLHIFLYAVTFAIWAVSLDPDKVAFLLNWLVPDSYVARVVAAISIIWTFFISAVPAAMVSSDEPDPPAEDQQQRQLPVARQTVSATSAH